MARGKKKESALTPEEKLAQALIPEGEQPYRVPENWCWTTLKNVSNIVMGQSPAGTDTTDDPSYIPLIGGAADMGALYPKATRYTKVPTKISHAEDIILCIRATLGRPIYSDGEYCLGRGVAAIRSTILSKEFLRFFFIDQEQYLYDNATGTTFAQINSDTLSHMPIALPPLAEQQRIVERIEYLFAKLDEAKEKAQSVLDSFETRKAAILHKAFNGELTAKWRAEHGVKLENWERLKLGEIGNLERGRSQHRPRNDPRLFNGPYPFIQTGDVASANVYVTDHRQTLSEFGMAQSRMFPVGTLCITIAANIGDVAILSYDCCFPDSVVGFTPNQRSISKFIYYMINVLQKELEDNAPATAQKNINLKILNAVEISIPTVEEQTEIVRILDGLFAKEQQAKEAAEAVLEKIDLLKKSILARAFHGELGTNAPSEESAVELLKSLFQA